MSKQAGSLTLAADEPCCPPIAQHRIAAGTAAALAPALKALGDPVRLQLMSMIASAADGEACVCDLTPAFELSGPTISHHLKTLREAGLVEAERRGTWVYYRARPSLLRQLAALLTVDSATVACGRTAAGRPAATAGPGAGRRRSGSPGVRLTHSHRLSDN